MPKKNNIEKEPHSRVETTTNLNELEQLRHIIYGSAREELICQLTALRQDMDKAFTEHAKKSTDTINEIRREFSKQLEDVGNKLQFIDKSHDDAEATIQKNLSMLTSEHEMFASTTVQDFKSIEQSLVSESSSLETKFAQQLEHLKAHLEEVSKELTTSKTDRKTLAKLLATMATNLEDDQL